MVTCGLAPRDMFARMLRTVSLARDRSVPASWTLVTFGAGLPNWRGAAHRLGRQARESGAFRSVIVLDETNLPRLDEGVWRQIQHLMSRRVRGFGYWVWKPLIVHAAMTQLDPGSAGIVYLDAGCQLNFATSQSVRRWNSYLDRASDGPGLFAMHMEGNPEISWTRLAVLDHFSVPEDIRLQPQIQATPFFANRTWSHEFAREWLNRCLSDQMHWVKDPVKGERQDSRFKAHRHDQSLFSILAKQAAVATIGDETFWAPDWSEDGRDYPVWAARNRTRVDILDRRVQARGIRFVEKSYSRAYLEAVKRIDHW